MELRSGIDIQLILLDCRAKFRFLRLSGLRSRSPNKTAEEGVLEG